jgi:hypothetical protein
MSLGAQLLNNTVISASTTNNIYDLHSILTGANTPFSNALAGGAATLYVSGDTTTYTNMVMGVYHAILINNVLYIVSQFEVSSTSAIIMGINSNNQLIIDNNHTGSINVSIRAVAQFDNQLHLV